MKRILLIACLLTASPAWASTYWVSKSGSNGNGCTNSASELTTTAKLTITAGIACLSAGDTLYIGAGTYVESFSTGLPSGTAGNIITISAYDLNNKPIIQPNTNADGFLITSDNYVTYIGLKIDMVNETVSDTIGNGVKIDVGSTYITWEDCEIYNVSGGSGTDQTMPFATSGSISNPNHITVRRCTLDRSGANGYIDNSSHCTYLNGVDNLLFEDNIVTNCGGYGIMIYKAGGLTTASTGNIIRNNIIHGTGSGTSDGRWGIMVSATQNCQIYNNIIYSNYGGINIGASSGEDVDGCTVYHNTVYNNTNSDGNAAGIWVRSGSTSTIIYNNISYLNATNCKNDGTGTTGVTAGTNCTNSSGGNLFGINPSFTNAAGGDFTIPSTSAARNMGVGTATTGILTDIIGTSREANPDAVNPDAGAYEFIYDPPDPPDPPDPGQPSGRTSFRRR